MKQLLRNSVNTMTLIAKDAFGVALPAYPPSSINLSIDDTVGANYPVLGQTWSNGVGTISFRTPDIVAQRTLKIKIGGTEVYCDPNPLEVDILDTYKGKFITTNAVFSFDCRVPNTTTASLFDYSGNGRHATPASATYYNNPTFTASSQYKAGPVGTLVTHGYACLSADNAEPTFSLNSTSYITTCPRVTESSLLTCSDFFSLPVKTFSAVVWRSNTATGTSWNYKNYAIFKTRINVGGKLLQVDVVRNVTTYSEYVTLTIAGPSSTINTNITISDSNHYWDTANQISIFTVVIIPKTATTFDYKFYINKTLVASGTDILLTTSFINTPVILGPGATFDLDGDHPTEKFAALEFVGYSDSKDATFISNNCTAWGY